MEYAGKRACFYTLTKANRRRRKRRNQRKQPNENAEGNPKKTAAGRERRLEPTLEQPHGRLPTLRKEGEKRRGHGRGIAASARPTERDVTSPAKQHQKSMPNAGRKRPCTKQSRHCRKNKSMVAMDVTNDEHTELEIARKEANNMRCKVPEMTTGAVKRRIRVLKAGAAPGPKGLRNNHIRAIAAAGGLRAIARWIAAWTKGKQGHQEMKAWNAALIVPLDRDGTRVRPIALTEALVKLAQGALMMERIHRKLRMNAEPTCLSPKRSRMRACR